MNFPPNQYHFDPKFSNVSTHSVSSAPDQRYRTLAPSTPWRAGGIRRFPWPGFFSLLFAVLAAASMVAVLVISNDKPVTGWTLSPAVYLAIASTVANILLNYALSEGVQVAWWVKSMKRGSNISDLHNVWSHGTSVRRALISGRSFNLVALACITVALAPVNGPLLQRASTITTASHNTEATLTILAAQEFPTGYTGTITGRAHAVGFVTSNFSSVTQDYVLKRPINVTHSGCQGRCSGLLQAAGYAIDCQESVLPFNLSSGLANVNGQVNTEITNGTNVFTTNFTYTENTFSDGQEGSHPSFNYTSMYKSDGKCWGNLKIAQCTLEPALLEYHVILVNDTISLDPGYTYKDDRLIQYVPAWGDLSQGPTTHGGMYLALNSLFSSSVHLRFTGAVGYDLQSTGAPALQYALAGLGSGSGDDIYDCPTYWSNPTADMLEATRELGFRTSLHAADATNATNIQTVNASAENIVTVYHSHYLYLVLAVGFTLLSTICVMPIFLGWWNLGRHFTLSPIEIAKAFDAPSLLNSDSNLNAQELLREVGDRPVRYGAVVLGNGDNRGQEKLVLGDPMYIMDPVKGRIYTG